MRILKQQHWILIICFIFSLLPSIYFSFQRDGLFCDELWTYGIANSTDYYALDPLSAPDYSRNKTGWVTGEYFSDYLKVNSGETFSYDAVTRNAKVDSHPALYYYILHTVSSIFPDTFSKWFGLIPNLVIFVIILIYFNKLCLLVFSKPWAYYIPMIWAISAAGINNIIFIRMYVLASLFTVMFTYYFWQFMCKNNFSLRNYFGLGTTIALGIISEFTIIPYFGAIAIMYLNFLLIRKEFKKCQSLLLTAIIGFGLGNLLYPAFLVSLIGNLSGKQGYLDFGEKIKYQAKNTGIFMEHLNNMLFGGFFSIICIFIIAILVGCFIKKIWGISIKTTDYGISFAFTKAERIKKTCYLIPTEHIACMMVIIAVFLSFALITRASNMNDNYGARVIYQLCPLIVFVLSFIFSQLCRMFVNRKFWATFLVCTGILLSVASVINFGIIWLFKGYSPTVSMSYRDRGMDCIYLYSKFTWNDLYAPATVLENYDEIYFLAIEDLEQNLDPILNLRESNDPLVLGFLTNSIDPTNTNNILSTIGSNNQYNYSFKYSLPYLTSDSAIVFYQLYK